jgi:hypothetical protein
MRARANELHHVFLKRKCQASTTTNICTPQQLNVQSIKCLLGPLIVLTSKIYISIYIPRSKMFERIKQDHDIRIARLIKVIVRVQLYDIGRGLACLGIGPSLSAPMQIAMHVDLEVIYFLYQAPRLVLP